MILPCQRDRFDIPADVTYLNCASRTPRVLRKRPSAGWYGSVALGSATSSWRQPGRDSSDRGTRGASTYTKMTPEKSSSALRSR
jgi:uncharacterized membrane protein